MRLSYYIAFTIFAFCISFQSFGQGEFESDTIPSLDFDTPGMEEVKPKKKKYKKKVFYGLKTRRGFTRKGVGQREVIENFFFLKHYKEPSPYAKKIYVFDISKQQIREISEINKKEVHNYRILHGPYKKMQGGEVIESGIFYVGTKHGRWEKYAPKRTDKYNDEEITYATLLDKEKFYKGFPKESKITFYDAGQTKMKEVIPYKFGKLNGDYFYFKENGDILIQGTYIEGKKAGLWVEFYKDKKQKLRETQYPANPYVEQFEPLVLSEWNEQGQLVISRGEKVEPGKKGADPLKERFRRNKKK